MHIEMLTVPAAQTPPHSRTRSSPVPSRLSLLSSLGLNKGHVLFYGKGKEGTHVATRYAAMLHVVVCYMFQSGEGGGRLLFWRAKRQNETLYMDLLSMCGGKGR